MTNWVLGALLLVIIVIVIGVVWATIRAADKTREKREQR
jgi:hypothetical protein